MSRGLIWSGVLLAAMVGLCATGCGGGSPAATGNGASAVAWGHDLPAALARAGSEKKLVMVDFYTDWCRWCRRLDETTFADGDVQRALKGVVTVRLNAEKDGREAAARFNVDGFPTIIFLDAAGGEVGRIPGYMEPGPFLQELTSIMKKA
jgi:thiol:disulfide interchange protein